jgi:uncharacterized RDD family membrane protein YckC
MSQETPVQTILVCSQCGRSLTQSELVQIAGSWVCADCKPTFLTRIMASGASSAAKRHGGFWIRFGARMVDGFALGVPFLIIAAILLPNLFPKPGQAPSHANPVFAPAFLGFLLVTLLAGGCYEILMLKYRSATLGKMACGLKVVRPDGSSLSWGVCVGRFFMWNVVTAGIPYLNSIMMLVSSIMLATDDEKRALHDRVCDTRVIYKRG